MKKPVLIIILAALVSVGTTLLIMKRDRGPELVFDETTAVFDQFSGQNAYDHVAKLVEIGPRIPGTEGHQKAQAYLVSQLEQLGWGVKTANFETKTPDGKVEFFNIRARFSSDKKPAAWDRPVSGILCSHYDTKKFNFEFVGANDGGSSTGALLEIARVLATKPELASKIELVWFDGEEAFGSSITDSDGLYGSRIYAAEMALVAKESKSSLPKWGILLDMIGDSDLKVRVGVNVTAPSLPERKEAANAGMSVDHHAITDRRRAMADDLISAAEDTGNRRKFGVSPSYIIDDHVPLNTVAGIPTIDIIDFDFDYWHTPGDTLDKISAESLEITGKTTLLLVEKYLLGQ